MAVPPPPPDEPRRRPWLTPLIAVVAVLVIGAVAFAGVKATSEPKADSVKGVAELAKQAAEDLDVDAAVALLCAPPTDGDLERLNQLIADAKDASGGEPDVSYDIHDVRDKGGRGSFEVTISTDEEALAGSYANLEVFVDSRGGKSCIIGIGGDSRARFKSK